MTVTGCLGADTPCNGMGFLSLEGCWLLYDGFIELSGGVHPLVVAHDHIAVVIKETWSVNTWTVGNGDGAIIPTKLGNKSQGGPDLSKRLSGTSKQSQVGVAIVITHYKYRIVNKSPLRKLRSQSRK